MKTELIIEFIGNVKIKDMQFTNETRKEFIEEYSKRTGKTIDKVNELYNFGQLVIKYGSDAKPYLVENPDYLNDEGKLKKVRRKNSHLTPKKKKRK